MSDWTGTGTPITPDPGAGTTTGCFAYLSVDDVRAEFGDDVAELTDAQIQRKIDRLAGELEAQIGHTFGRAVVASSTASDVVVVTETGVTIGGDAYLFAAYATLGALAAAINGAGATYQVDLLANPATPSTYLKEMAAAAIGPAYEQRAVLCLSALWVQLTGGETHLFLPLPLQSVTAVTENGVALSSGSYWALAGESWIIRKCCSCVTTSSCFHPRGRWSNRYPGSITVAYVPMFWGRAPSALSSAMLEAFGLQSGVGAGGPQSESFGEYSYSRGSASSKSQSWVDVLGGPAVRRYAVKWAP